MEVYRSIKTQSSTLPFHPKSALYCAPTEGTRSENDLFIVLVTLLLIS